MEINKKNRKIPLVFNLAALTIVLLGGIYGIIAAKNFLYPIVLAILFAFLIFPAVNFFEKKLKFPRIISILLTEILVIALIVGIVYVMFTQFRSMFSDIDTIKTQVSINIQTLKTFVLEKFNYNIDVNQLKTGINNLLDSSSEYFARLFKSTTGTIARTIILPIYVFFMLYYRDKFRHALLSAFPKEKLRTGIEIVEQVAKMSQRYIIGVSTVVLILCIVNPLGLWIVGLEYALALGIIAGICNYISYFGTIIGFAFPLTYALIAGDAPNEAIGVIIVFVIVQFTENNILTPSIVGGELKLNPIVIIVGLIAGAMVWGIPGMLVVVPLLATLRIVSEKIDKLKPLVMILSTGGTERHALTLKKIKKLFSRNKK